MLPRAQKSTSVSVWAKVLHCWQGFKSNASQKHSKWTSHSIRAPTTIQKALNPEAACAVLGQYRLGFVSQDPRNSTFAAAFEQRLRELDYVDGSTLTVEFIDSHGERYRGSRDGLVRRKRGHFIGQRT